MKRRTTISVQQSIRGFYTKDEPSYRTFQVLDDENRHFQTKTIYLNELSTVGPQPPLAQIQVFWRGASMSGGCQRGRSCRGCWRHPPPESFELSSPQKCDFRHSEATSACFNILIKSIDLGLVINKVDIFSIRRSMHCCL